AFEPTDVQLSDLVVPTAKAGDEPPRSVNINAADQPPASSFDPQFPLDHTVVAIDSTSVVLGYVPEGLVGALRASVITKPEGSTHHHMDRYGAYLAVITNYTKDDLYAGVRELVYGKPTPARAPDLRKTLDRLRNLLERHLQLQAVRAYSDALVLVDGSLMAGAVADPMFVIKKLVQDASAHRNSIAALSKSTTLTLSENQLGILSLVDGVASACYVGDLREHITQQKDRYVGCVYVGRLAPQGEAFRFDIPEDTALPHDTIFSMMSGLSGEHGYPEALKLAHMTSIFSSIEVLELQAAAIKLHGLELKDNVRRKLFPM
ncbi:MAG: DNA double-strand break repair nuclease NurA, partial [Halobacteriota archaeon]